MRMLYTSLWCWGWIAKYKSKYILCFYLPPIGTTLTGCALMSSNIELSVSPPSSAWRHDLQMGRHLAHLKYSASFFLLAMSTIDIKMTMLKVTALMTRLLFWPLLSDTDPLFLLKAWLFLSEAWFIVGAVPFRRSIAVGPVVGRARSAREVVFWSLVLVLPRCSCAGSCVVGESDSVVCRDWLSLVCVVAAWFTRTFIAPEFAFLVVQAVWHPGSCLGLQWRCLGRPWALHWPSNWSLPSQQQIEHSRQSKTNSLS